ncbi:MAG: hypothetical protein HY747_01580, partial [Elusimicrobia bacterium]|nr:hypothetical protein [Elusimicrobiota bacterium]
MVAERYEPQKIELKWQKLWDEAGVFKTGDKPPEASLAKGGAPGQKYYVLDMFPYPSAAGLHV